MSATVSSRSAGFTLLELIIAIALVGLVAVALAGGIRLGARVWEAGDARAERVAATDTLRQYSHGLVTLRFHLSFYAVDDFRTKVRQLFDRSSAGAMRCATCIARPIWKTCF